MQGVVTDAARPVGLQTSKPDRDMSAEAWLLVSNPEAVVRKRLYTLCRVTATSLNLD